MPHVSQTVIDKISDPLNAESIGGVQYRLARIIITTLPRPYKYSDLWDVLCDLTLAEKASAFDTHRAGLFRTVVAAWREHARVAHLRAAYAEFYRCVVAPYEDKKIAENGNAYAELLK